jgi:hypothetical protein
MDPRPVKSPRCVHISQVIELYFYCGFLNGRLVVRTFFFWPSLVSSTTLPSGEIQRCMCNKSVEQRGRAPPLRSHNFGGKG